MADPRYDRTLIPRPRRERSPRERARVRLARELKRPRSERHPWLPAAASVALLAFALFSLPSVLAVDLKDDYVGIPQPFTLTVYPDEKRIVEDPAIEELLTVAPTSLAASSGILETIYRWVAIRVSDTSVYQQLAGTLGIEQLFVTIHPGQRSEEVAAAFSRKLGWSGSQRAEFLKEVGSKEPGLPDGQFVPGTYFVSVTEPVDVANITRQRFESEILSRYSTTTEEVVPLEDALIIASLIEREAGGWDDMRLISGIIWNRLFLNMNLQIDATMQYSKATLAGGKDGWWPTPLPKDKNIRHAYNTYRGPGLPPGPIANPSIAAVVAALNPKKTDCVFYFHDSYGRFHCSPTYEGHVALLRKHYGQGR